MMRSFRDAWFVEPSPDGAIHGGSKAKRDAGAIFVAEGLKPLRLGGRSALEKAVNLARLLLFAIRPRRTVIFHFPSYGGSTQLALALLAKRHRIVFLLHDVDQARDVSPTQSLAALDQGAAVIVTGRLDQLAQVGGTLRRVVRLECWDYLVASAPDERPARSEGVLFAGSLSPRKSAWLYARDRTLPLLLAGTQLDSAAMLAQDRYLGEFSADDPGFPEAAGWGLVWDGDSAQDLAGATGTYQRHNQPHKFSMYLAAGLPVICHEDAAVARLVTEWNIGFCVRRIDDIPQRLAAMDEAAREALRANVRAYRTKVRNGAFLRQSLGQLAAALE